MQDEGYSTIQVGGPRAKKRGVALVDRADAEMVSAYSWRMDGKGYVMRSVRVGGKCLYVYMHRQLLGLVPGDGNQVDHINGDVLDNRRENLRVVTSAQNNQNRHTRSHRGASWNAKSKRWRAQAELSGRYYYLGSFATQEEAAAVASAWRREHMPYSADARVD